MRPASKATSACWPAMRPFMTALKAGSVTVYRRRNTTRVFAIEGGFADVTPAGLTILAEQAVES